MERGAAPFLGQESLQLDGMEPVCGSSEVGASAPASRLVYIHLLLFSDLSALSSEAINSSTPTTDPASRFEDSKFGSSTFN